MISIEHLTKKFDDRYIFHDFNLNIQTGELIVLSGPSGCGKTTLLNMIGGLETANSGRIIIDDYDIFDKKNQLYFYKKKIGFLFQNFALIDNKTVKENLAIIKKDTREKNISYEDVLSYVGLKKQINTKVYKLSGGEQQRIALARLLLKKNDLILADEPTGSLDKNNANAVMSILEDMNKRGKTVIIVTHDEEIKRRAKRVIEL